MRKVMKIFGLLWRLGRERGLVALYGFSAFCLILTCFMPKAYFRLQLITFVVFLAVNAALVLRAVMETLMDAVIETLEWLYYDAPLLPHLFRLARWAWQQREAAMKAVYLWSYRLLLKNERFSQEHSAVENLILGGVAVADACFVWGAIYAITTNRYPPYGPVLFVCGYIFIAGIVAFLFFVFVALLNAAMEWFYRLRAGGFFDALRLAASVFITVSRELVLNRLRSSGPESRVHAKGPGADGYEPHPLTLTVLPPLEKESHQCR
jgi:hypothetical protein